MSHFELKYHRRSLSLNRAFTISRGSRNVAENVFVSLEADGLGGYGEAAPNARYGESPETVIRFFEALPAGFFDDISSGEELCQKLTGMKDPVQSGSAALEMAWLDWWGKKQEKPLWKLWEASSNTGPRTSFTIGIDTTEKIRQKVIEAEEYPVLKVKLGTERDRKIIHTIRELTDKPLRVDVNEGWKTLEEARRGIDFLADQNVELIEQPMPADQLEEIVKLKAHSPIPLCADESFKGTENLDRIAEAFDIINIKLMKTGSIIKAKRLIEEARKRGLEVMIGCMIESSLANTAGALLSLWAEYADLDGHLLIKDDPFEGIKLNEKKEILLNSQPGLGVRPAE